MTSVKSVKIEAQECIIDGHPPNYSVPRLFVEDYDIGTVSIINHMLDTGYDANKMLAAICASGSQNDLLIPIALCLRHGANVDGNVMINGKKYKFLLALAGNTRSADHFASYYYAFRMFGINMSAKLDNGEKVKDVLTQLGKYYGELDDVVKKNPPYITKIGIICRVPKYVVKGTIAPEKYCQIQVYAFVPPTNIYTERRWWYDLSAVHAINSFNLPCFRHRSEEVSYPIVNKIIHKISEVGLDNRWLIRQLLLMINVSTSHTKLDGYQNIMLNKAAKSALFDANLSDLLGQDIMNVYINIPGYAFGSFKQIMAYVATGDCGDKGGSYYIPSSTGQGGCYTPESARKELMSQTRVDDKKLSQGLRRVRSMATDYDSHPIVVEYESLDGSVILTDANSSANSLDAIVVKYFQISCLKYLTEEHARVTFCWIGVWSYKNQNRLFEQMMTELGGGNRSQRESARSAKQTTKTSGAGNQEPNEPTRQGTMGTTRTGVTRRRVTGRGSTGGGGEEQESQ